VGLFALLVVNCARTGLEPWDLDESQIDSAGTGGGPPTRLPIGGADAGLDAEPPDAEVPDAELPDAEVPDAEPPDAEIPDATVAPEPIEPGPRPCIPHVEICNGVDDDCDDIVDEVPPEACSGGGMSYCIAGTMSACPRRCEVCAPGGVRICQHSYCTFWGEQECASDGQGFGPCRERQPPPECAGIARTFKSSPELEQCCLDNGYCCIDLFDLDGDENKSELLGNCDDVRCD
jgi:hypothetical protein